MQLPDELKVAIDGDAFCAMATHLNKNEIQNYINNLNLSLSQPEKIKRFEIIEIPFSMENELLTPTMKVRRHKVYEQYKELIDNL